MNMNLKMNLKMNNYKYTAVIIDSRITDLFEIVLDNFYSNLDERWGFIIMTTNNNFEYIKDLVFREFNKETYRTTIIKFNIDHISSSNIYSNLFYYKSFYSYIPTEIFMIFQLDSLLSNKYSSNIYNFINYDYIGSPFYYQNDYFYVGCGGLSIRKKSKMIEIVNDINYNNENNRKLPEDLFFCEYHNIYKAPYHIALEFCSGVYFHPNSIGIHKTFDFITEDEINIIQLHIPKIKDVMYKYRSLQSFTSPNDVSVDNITKNAYVYNYNNNYIYYLTIIIIIITFFIFYLFIT